MFIRLALSNSIIYELTKYMELLMVFMTFFSNFLNDDCFFIALMSISSLYYWTQLYFFMFALGNIFQSIAFVCKINEDLSTNKPYIVCIALYILNLSVCCQNSSLHFLCGFCFYLL